ncbi:MAG: ABC transporter permease [Clostridiales bacterium]|nr:ABC transporter permease [Clostridiales bacterium]
MKTLYYLVARNCKLFYKDKGLFFSSLIAPLILMFLFFAFLGNVYRDSLMDILPEGVEVEKRLVEGFAGGWLMSSLLAVCTVTIAFTANLMMVQDKVTGRINDFAVSPVSKRLVALGYYLSTALVTLCICLIAMFVGFIYLAAVGWYLSASDVFLIILDTVLLTLFGTALSSIVCRFLKSQGAITAVETVVSAAYGFLCGAYMPISSLAAVLQDVLMFLPGTYGTALMHEHFMGGAIDALGESGIPAESLARIRGGFDCTLSFFGSDVPAWVCYLVLAGTVALLVAAYVLICTLSFKKAKKKQQ